MRWFHDHLPGGLDAIAVDGAVQVTDISDNVCGYALSGPDSRKVLEQLVHEDISNESMRFMSCREMDVGLIRAKVGRLSVAGELGFEINCHALEMSALRDSLTQAGRELGIREYGYYALNTLRMEKSFGIWNAEFMQAYTPGETHMDRWIAWDKPDFIGREKALQEHSNGPAALAQTLVTLEIENAEAEAVGYEPVWAGADKRIGMTTSGGYGHSVDKSLAMALVPPDYASAGTELTTHIVGVERTCRVIDTSPWDPGGKRMRG